MIRRLLRAHGDLLIGAAALCAGVFMSCVLGPTLDAQSPTLTTQDGGSKTAYAAKD
ncbi:hypothetical protein [Achromobacter aegrifaciens]